MHGAAVVGGAAGGHPRSLNAPNCIKRAAAAAVRCDHPPPGLRAAPSARGGALRLVGMVSHVSSGILVLGFVILVSFRGGFALAVRFSVRGRPTVACVVEVGVGGFLGSEGNVFSAGVRVR